MRLLMLSGDRQACLGEQGPFTTLQREFSKYFERIDVLCPPPDRPVTVETIFERVHLHPAQCTRAKLVGWLAKRGEELIAEHGATLVVSHDYGWFYNGMAAARIRARTGVPYLSEIHHVPGFPVAESWRERFERRIARRYLRWFHGPARLTQTPSATTRDELVAHGIGHAVVWGRGVDGTRALLLGLGAGS